jgi:hypothetical protein
VLRVMKSYETRSNPLDKWAAPMRHTPPSSASERVNGIHRPPLFFFLFVLLVRGLTISINLWIILRIEENNCIVLFFA